ncbi:NADH-quinone oxidoreductase subunit NuoH [Sulfodiicoccus acidiphilus]|nr:NADH-quinone oxidoreductase subunit NuoH [Sulfodiicoccus acidiphilus]
MNILSTVGFYVLYPSFFIMIIFPGLIFALVVLLYTIWFERKIAAKVQMRFGPLYASKRSGGFLQLVADAIKFAFSEIIVPEQVNRTLFVLGPVLYLLVSILPLALIPLSVIPIAGSPLSVYYHTFFDSSVGTGVVAAVVSNYSLLLVLALESVTPIFVLLTAWVTNNRFALLGAVREGLLSVSYDVLLIMASLSLAIEYHTLDIAKIVEGPLPGFVANPFAAFLFLIGMLIGTGRFPFDIVEAESELVAGPYTEYSGLLFVLSMGGSYIGTFSYSILFADLFLGGWQPFTGYYGMIFTVFKAVLVLMFAVFMRSVYGRYRIDQALRGSWKYLFPLALVSLVLGGVVGVWIR